MNTKFLKQGLILLILSMISAAVVIYSINTRQTQRFGGESVFAQTLDNLTNIGTITIETPLTTVNLELKDNLWRVREADDYYAGSNLINSLFNDFNSSTFFRHRKDITPEEEGKYNLDNNGFRIITRAPDGKILNSILIGGKTTNGLYHYAKAENQPGIYLITGRYALPKKMSSWLQQPLLSLSPSEVSDFTAGGNTASRTDVVIPFKNSETERNVNIDNYLNALTYVNILNARQEDGFDKSAWSEHKEVIITTFDGLVVKFDIYTDQKEYWASAHFSTTTLPTTNISDYIEDNAFLYNGWYFKLAPSTGRILFNAYIQ